MDTSRVIGIATAAILFLLAGCGGGGDGGTPGFPNTGTVALQITDGPFFEEGSCVTQAWITIPQAAGVQVKSDSGVFVDLDIVEPTDAVASDTMAWEGGLLRVNLLSLTNGVIADLAAGQLPAGAYSEIRLLVEDTELVFEDGSTSTFKVPSGSSSGLKIKVRPSFVVAPGKVTHLDLDFSLAKSFHTAGLGGEPSCDDLREGRGKVLYHPSIRVVNNDTSGLLEGFVLRPETTMNEATRTRHATLVGVAGAGVWAVRRDPPLDAEDAAIVMMTTTEGEDSEWGVGYYAFILEAGEYDLYTDNPEVVEGAEPATPVAEGIIVVANDVATHDITLTP